MDLLSRLLHVLLCLALVAGGPGVGGIASAQAHAHSAPPVPVAAGCHDAEVAADAADAPQDADAATDDCCDDGACPCPCPTAAQVVLAVPGLALPVLRPAHAQAIARADARGPPRLASLIRPPIG